MSATLVGVFLVFSGLGSVLGIQRSHELAKLKEIQDICETETFLPRCSRNEVIVMTSARYGRMHIGTCVKKNMGYMGCFSNVMTLMDRRCSGRTSCQVRIPDPDLDVTKPCIEELKTYLQVQYQCVTVMRPPVPCSNNVQWLVTDSAGYITNSVAMDKQCGLMKSPITIQASPGQRINLTLYNFDPLESSSSMDFMSQRGSSECYAYAHIIDKAAGRTIPVCRGGAREKHAYISSNRSVELAFPMPHSEEFKRGPFLIYFEAIGCADVAAPEGMWVKRTENEAQVGCPKTREVWTLVCVDGAWMGEISNCSKSIIMKPGDSHTGTPIGLSHSVSVIIIVTIAIGIGVAVLFCGIFVIKRMRKNSTREVHIDVGRPNDETEELEQLKVNYDNEMRKCHQNEPEILQHVIYDKSKKDVGGYSPLHTCMHDATHVQMRGPEVLWKANTLAPPSACDYETRSKTLNSCASQGTLKDNIAMVQPCTLSTFASNQNKPENVESATLPTSSHSQEQPGGANPTRESLRSFHESVYGDRGACVHTRDRMNRNPRNIYEAKRTRVLYALNNSF